MSEIRNLHEPFIAWLKTLPVVFRRSRSDTRTSEAPGEPDFSIFRGPMALHIEFKTEKGPISKAQKKRHAEYAAAGATVHVIRRMEDAQTLVTQWLETLKRWGVDQPKAKGPEEELRINGDWVWRKTNVGFVRYRRATDADLGLPRLIPN